ncbi:MAG: C2H2-type zinc finger protein [Gemmatimonadales bacterium]
MAEDKGFTCRECGERFKTGQELDEHNRKKHSRTGEPREPGRP